MNENNMQPSMMKKSGNNRGVLVIAIIVVIVAIGFFVFMDKNDDTSKGSTMKDSEAMMKDEGESMKKDGEALAPSGVDEMMEKGDAMMVSSVKYTNAGFAPAALEIKAGETVTFVNESETNMWVASAIHPTHELLPAFDQKTGTPKGSVYSFTFNNPGVWKFHDHLNPGAKGSVTVK